MPRCRKCEADIYWLKLVKKDENGRIVPVPNAKSNPIDARPHADGKLVIDVKKESYRFATKSEIDTVKYHGGRLYISHFETCPAAEEFRKQKKTAAKPEDSAPRLF